MIKCLTITQIELEFGNVGFWSFVTFNTEGRHLTVLLTCLIDREKLFVWLHLHAHLTQNLQDYSIFHFVRVIFFCSRRLVFFASQ